jgi:putative hydrolase of the HAD superfamily
MSLRAILFDYGGTLDAPGIPWVERFLSLYHEGGLDEPEERIRAAFGHATRCAYGDEKVRGFNLEQTVAFHVEHQCEYLERHDAKLSKDVGDRFVALARAHLQASRATLKRLQPRLALGVVSNFYGNVHLLLEEAGIAPLLSVILDSTRVGLSKPDPAIFRLALKRLGCAATEAMYVGDSFEKDVVGAHAAGVHTAWLGPAERPCPDPELVELRLKELAELESLLAGGCFA